MKDLRKSIPRSPLIDQNGYVTREWLAFITELAGQVYLAAPRLANFEQATGTADRTTFDTATVTLPELAERLKALIDDTV